jgi:NADH-quinone oxidoreductase subunit M
MTSFPWLSLIIFLPLAGSVLVLLFRNRPDLCRWTSLTVAATDLGLIVSLLAKDLTLVSGPTGTWFLVEDIPWIEYFGIRYSLGLDGISFLLILLTACLEVLCVLVSWRQINTRIGAFHFFLLSLETVLLGLFLATDVFLFYLFWEVQLIPMFFLIGMWGHEKRMQATFKFITYTIAGSVIMLIAVISLYVIHGSQTGDFTFSLHQLRSISLFPATQWWLFAAFLLAFAIKIPLIPVHSWLPDAHTEAPTAGSVILAGLLLKTGAYALIRFGFPLFPVAAKLSVPLLLAAGLGGLCYASWVALAQEDIKRLVAYSSIGHMGLVVVGIAIWNMLTLSGAVLQMINHGLTTSALFMLVGMLDERVHTRRISDFGGLWRKMPVYGAFFLFFAMSSLGLPGLNNFVGEILILIGTFQVNPLAAAIGFGGLVLTVIYVLWLVQSTLFGKTRKTQIQEMELKDITVREACILAPLAAAILVLGWYPGPVLDLLQESVAGLIPFLK